jgi:hypothetical protein
MYPQYIGIPPLLSVSLDSEHAFTISSIHSTFPQDATYRAAIGVGSILRLTIRLYREKLDRRCEELANACACLLRGTTFHVVRELP